MISSEELKILKSFAERIPPEDPGAHNNLAIVYYNKGLYDEAIEELEKALKIDPNFVLARNNLDIILKKTGRLEEKVERLARILDREPYDEEKTLELADTYRKLSRYSQSIIFYRKVLDYNPGSFEGHYGLGITLKFLGKYDDALEEIKKALEIKIAPDVYRTLGEIYFNKGIIDLAIRNFQEAINLAPSSAESHFLLGFAYGEKGKVEESLQEVKKAIAINPALAQFEPNLSIDIKEHKGQWDFLKEQLGVPKISQNEFDVHYNMGMTYRNKGLFKEAKKEFEECLKFSNNNPELHLALGQVNLFLYKLDDALKYLEKAYKTDFDVPLCTNALGVFHCLKSEFQKAVEWFEKTLTLQNDFVSAQNNLGVCYFNMGEIEQAVSYYSKAEKAGSTDARINLGMYYLLEGDYKRALSMFTGKTPVECFGRGLVYSEQGKDTKALEFFKKTLSLEPNHAGSYYNIGFIQTKQGKFKEGLDYIRKGMEIEPNYEKKKLYLSLDPQLPALGPYFSPSQAKRMTVDEAKPITEILKKPEPDEMIIQAEEIFDRNEFAKALNIVEQILEIKPGWKRAVLLKSKVLFEMGSTDDAIQILTDYHNKNPDDDIAYATIGKMFQRKGNLEQAQEVYNKLLSKQPDQLEWMKESAEISFTMKNYDKALVLYEKMYELNGDSIAANLGFLKIHVKNKSFENARKYLDYLGSAHPELFDFNILAGQYYFEQNDRQKAMNHFSKAIEIDSSRALPYYHLGLLLVQKGDFESACDNWKKALLLSPDQDLTKKIKHCLKITVELSEFLKKEV